LSLAKVRFIKHSLAIRRYEVCSDVAAYYIKSMEVCCVLCAVCCVLCRERERERHGATIKKFHFI